MVSSLTAVIPHHDALASAQALVAQWHNANLISDNIVVVRREDFISNFIGRSSDKTLKLLNENLGNVILIDDANTLVCEEHDTFGIEVIDTIIQFLSDHSGQIGIILSGDSLDHLFELCPDFHRRFGSVYEG